MIPAKQTALDITPLITWFDREKKVREEEKDRALRIKVKEEN